MDAESKFEEELERKRNTRRHTMPTEICSFGHGKNSEKSAWYLRLLSKSHVSRKKTTQNIIVLLFKVDAYIAIS